MYNSHQVTVGGGGGAAERVEIEAVAGRYFETLRVRPILGRSFLPEEVERAGAPATVLIAESLWQERFAADPSVLGRTLNVDGKPRTIVGVMPSSFTGLSGLARVWAPFPSEAGATVESIQARHVKDFLTWRRVHRLRGSQPVSNRTLAKDRAVLHRLFTIADKHEYREGNPVRRVDPPKSDPRDPVILDEDQYDALVRVCDGRPMMKLYVLILGEAGLRM